MVLKNGTSHDSKLCLAIALHVTFRKEVQLGVGKEGRDHRDICHHVPVGKDFGQNCWSAPARV